MSAVSLAQSQPPSLSQNAPAPNNRQVDSGPNAAKPAPEPVTGALTGSCKAQGEQALEAVLNKVSVNRDLQGRVSIGPTQKDIDSLIGAYNTLKTTVDGCDDLKGWRQSLRTYGKLDDLKNALVDLLSHANPSIYVSGKSPVRIRIGDAESPPIVNTALPIERLERLQQEVEALSAAVRGIPTNSGPGLMSIVLPLGLFVLGLIIVGVSWHFLFAPGLADEIESRVAGHIQHAVARGDKSEPIVRHLARLQEKIDSLSRTQGMTSTAASYDRRAQQVVPPTPQPPPFNPEHFASEVAHDWRLARDEPRSFKEKYNAIGVGFVGGDRGELHQSSADIYTETLWAFKTPMVRLWFVVPSPKLDVPALTVGDNRRAIETFGGVLKVENGDTELVMPARAVEQNGGLVIDRLGVLRLPAR